MLLMVKWLAVAGAMAVIALAAREIGEAWLRERG